MTKKKYYVRREYVSGRDGEREFATLHDAERDFESDADAVRTTLVEIYEIDLDDEGAAPVVLDARQPA